jgi:glutamate-1-semialdehyde 2,1-aminomutase
MTRIDALIEIESARFERDNPRSAALAREARAHWLGGAPMHWMGDWPSPTPLFAAGGYGARVIDADGHVHDDFCLGDSPAMFGHAPAALTAALSAQAERGATFMLPTAEAIDVGARLAARFSLPFWQTSVTASDSNRAVIRWARAVTGRKTLVVFDGCYHGMVDDTFVTLDGGVARMDPALVGQVADLTDATRVIAFNDLAALEAALAPGDVAAVLAEPAMTNCGMILPAAGYHAALARLTRAAGALLILDETHTLSTGPGGYARAFDLAPDMVVIGKAIAGGVPASVWGVSADVAARIAAVRARLPRGHSGIGTTLAGNALAIAAIGAMLRDVMTDSAYRAMRAGAARLTAGLAPIAMRAGWSVVALGARVELVFAPSPPPNAAAMRAALGDGRLQALLHLFLMNRRILLTPFHNMMLICPETSAAQIDRLVAAVDDFAQMVDEGPQ